MRIVTGSGSTPGEMILMPSGSYGCLACGEPTASMLRLRVEDFKHRKTEAAMKGADRKVIDTWTRSFCEDHADEAYAAAVRAVEDFVKAVRADAVQHEERGS